MTDEHPRDKRRKIKPRTGGESNPQCGIEDRINSLPVSPGVYLMKGSSGEVLYIGKAKDLRARVRSYFRPTGDTRYAVRFLASRTADVDCIVTANELEALLLEDTLLKRERPRYNIRLKDSKTYVSIKLTMAEEFPRILVTRQRKKDGSRYFGPYISAREVRDTIKFIRRVFPLRVCGPAVFRNRVRPCLDYQMGLCSAPAVGLISREDYAELVEGAVMFLEGRGRELARALKEKMTLASRAQEYEKAALMRDRISAMKRMTEEQKVVSRATVDRDVFSFARSSGAVAMQALFIRGGRLVGAEGWSFTDAELPDEEIVSSFLSRFYGGERAVPDEVVLPILPGDAAVIAAWLSDKKGKAVRLLRPVRGERAKLVAMAEANARESLRKKAADEAVRASALDELKSRLRLARRPERIEGYDISNLGGAHPVGAMVSFRDGAPDKGSYRLFKIRCKAAPDDYAMMREALSRRFRDGGRALPPPDLIIVDGGKGQLNIALKALSELGVEGVDMAAIAKDGPLSALHPALASKGERVYLPNVKDPVLLREGSRPDLLVRRIRDEVHRFAVSFHRRLRAGSVSSLLDDVPGIGAKKRKALLDRFGDLKGVLDAPMDELMKVSGVTEGIAAAIKALKA
jgi:excinuclease ABC subunit C